MVAAYLLDSSNAAIGHGNREDAGKYGMTLPPILNGPDAVRGARVMSVAHILNAPLILEPLPLSFLLSGMDTIGRTATAVLRSEEWLARGSRPPAVAREFAARPAPWSPTPLTSMTSLLTPGTEELQIIEDGDDDDGDGADGGEGESSRPTTLPALPSHLTNNYDDEDIEDDADSESSSTSTPALRFSGPFTPARSSPWSLRPDSPVPPFPLPVPLVPPVPPRPGEDVEGLGLRMYGWSLEDEDENGKEGRLSTSGMTMGCRPRDPTPPFPFPLPPFPPAPYEGTGLLRSPLCPWASKHGDKDEEEEVVWTAGEPWECSSMNLTPGLLFRLRC